MKKRIAKVCINYFDPWTNEWLAGGFYTFDKRRAARGHYSKTAIALKKIARTWLPSFREPKLVVSFI